MWSSLSVAVLLLSSACVLSQPVQPTRCGQVFGNAIQACFKNVAGVDQNIAYSILSNGKTGALPQGANKDAITQTMCSKYNPLGQCLTNVKANQDPTCQQNEAQQNTNTINNLIDSMGTICGAGGGQPQPQPDPAAPSGMATCLKKFETSLDGCVSQIQVTPDQFKAFLAEPTKPIGGVSPQQLTQRICGDAPKQTLMTCAQNVRTQAASQCTDPEVTMVDGALQGIISRYDTVCTPCYGNFQMGIDACISRLFNLDRDSFAMMMNVSQPLPNGMNRDQIKKQICAKGMGSALRNCGRDLIVNAECPDRLTALEFEFARLVMAHGQFCGDQSLPGLCLLNLQKKFGQCYNTVGLDPAIYLGNDTEHRGALIGSNTQEVEVYCNKKHDLYTCMTEVMQGCPGAEQTLTMTGFDLHSMERAVGLLCQDIPDYLAGLQCFAQPSEQAMACMEEMTRSITEVSAKQLQKSLNMDSFLQNFCTARVQHVGCDSKAWPTCQDKAVNLKNQFECLLIPSKCYASHKDNIDMICPETNIVVPTEGTKMIIDDQQPLCVQNIESTMMQCFQSHGLEADIFLVNITHDRGTFLGSPSQAQSLCSSRNDVFACMRSALSACPTAAGVLAYWGHQQKNLEESVNVICQDIETYKRGYACFSNGNSVVQQCIANTERKMIQLGNKMVDKQLSPDAYFRDFCSLRVEHMKCDLNGWKSQCSSEAMGLKTEFECKLLQTNCKNLQVAVFKQVCNEESYVKSARLTGPGGAASSVSGLPVLVGMAAAFVSFFL